jgi:hypothetical protein
MDQLIQAENEFLLSPNNMNREDGLIVSMSWTPLIRSQNVDACVTSPQDGIPFFSCHFFFLFNCILHTHTLIHLFWHSSLDIGFLTKMPCWNTVPQKNSQFLKFCPVAHIYICYVDFVIQIIFFNFFVLWCMCTYSFFWLFVDFFLVVEVHIFWSCCVMLVC